MPLLDEMSAEAQQIGAVNSVTIANNGRTVGYNTDRIGFRRNFEEGLGRACVEGKTAVLVGAGGAGRAVAFALMDLGAATVLRARHGHGARRGAGCRPHAALRRRALRGWPTRFPRRSPLPPASSTPRRSACTGFPGNPVPVEALRAAPLGCRRHLHADRDRAHQGRARDRRPRADRRRHVRAPGGRDVPPVHRAARRMSRACTAPSRRRSPRAMRQRRRRSPERQQDAGGRP